MSGFQSATQGNTALRTKESNPMPNSGASASPQDAPRPDGATTYTNKHGSVRVLPGSNLRLVWDIFVAFPNQPLKVEEGVALLSDYGFDAMKVSGAMSSFAWPVATHYKPGHRLKPAPNTAAGIMGHAPGLVYRVSRGVYVYDTGARLFRGKIVDNSFSCWAGKGLTYPPSPPAPPLSERAAAMRDSRAEEHVPALLPSTLADRLAQLQAMQPAALRPVPVPTPTPEPEPNLYGVGTDAEREERQARFEAAVEAEAEAERTTLAAMQPTYTVEFLLHETSPNGDTNTLSLEDLDLGPQPSLVAAISAWIFVRDSR